jgi:hypothetical protein
MPFAHMLLSYLNPTRSRGTVRTGVKSARRAANKRARTTRRKNR